MHVHASAGYTAFLEISDATGIRLNNVVAAFTDTGQVRQLALNSYGEAFVVNGDIQEVWDFYPAPLRVFDTRLGLEITSQSQLDFIERSRRSAHAANIRWEMLCRRADTAWDALMYKSGCSLGNPTIKVVWRGEE